MKKLEEGNKNNFNQYLDSILSELSSPSDSNFTCVLDAENDKCEKSDSIIELTNVCVSTSVEDSNEDVNVKDSTKSLESNRPPKKSNIKNMFKNNKKKILVCSCIVFVGILLFCGHLFFQPKLTEYVYLERVNDNIVVHTEMDCSKISQGTTPIEVETLKGNSTTLFFCPKCTNESIVSEITGKKLSFHENNMFNSRKYASNHSTCSSIENDIEDDDTHTSDDNEYESNYYDEDEIQADDEADIEEYDDIEY